MRYQYQYINKIILPVLHLGQLYLMLKVPLLLYI